MKNPYKILDVEQDASEAEIKKAYRKKAQDAHPDKGGDTELFQEIAKAYEILSDAEKREHFDKTGEEYRDEVKAEVIGALIQIVIGAIQKQDTTYVDIIDVAKKAVTQQQSRHEIAKAQLEEQVSSLKNAAERISVVEGKENILADAILSNMNEIQNQIAIVDKVISIGTQILEILQDYSYRKEASPMYWGNSTITMPIWKV